MQKIELYVSALEEIFVAAANPENTESMQKYMRNHFAFLGIKTPERKALIKAFIAKYGWPSVEDLPVVVKTLWEMPAREFQYVAIEMLVKHAKKLPENSLELLEYCITRKSWWDSVDSLASTVGVYFEKYPAQLPPTNARWLSSGNMWLQRSALIFQLRYRARTDEKLLHHNILQLASSKEFFIQKAIGWSLRQYARTNPSAVQNFVATHALPPLSRREALKHFD